MALNTLRLGSLAAVLAVLLAGCERSAPEQPSTPATSEAAAPAAPAPLPTVPGPPRGTAPALDVGALEDRQDPDRLLRYYAAALRARDWAAAARAWGPGSGVTAATLKASYDRAEPPVLSLGQGEVEGAAGSLYYEAPAAISFGGRPPERGSLVLRRVNDVPGASDQQLRWHIERSTIGAGQ